MNFRIIAIIIFPFAISHCGWGQKLTIQKEGVFFTDDRSKLVLHNSDWINNGEHILNGDSSVFVFSGSAKNVIGGNRSTGIANLKMAKSNGGQLELEQSIFIDNSIEFLNGILNINNQHITLDSDARLLHENDQSRIFTVDTGTVGISIIPQKDYGINPGNLGFGFTPSQYPGIVTVVRGHKPQIAQPEGTGINRFYEVYTENEGSFDTIRFHYLPAELNGLKETEINILTRLQDYGWEVSEKKDQDTKQHFIEILGIDSIYRWTAASELSILPVVFGEITTKCLNNQLQLTFTTGQESNIDHYKIMKSENGRDWDPAGTITTLHNTSAGHYNFTDKTPQKFYRIEAVNLDGTVTHSSTQKTSCSVNDPFILVFPNPFRDYINLQIRSEEKTAIKIKIFDMEGKPVFSKDPGSNSRYLKQTLNTSSLAPGSYTLSITQPAGKILRNFNLVRH